MTKIYLAGPDIFHPKAQEIAENKKAICERYGLEAVSQLDIGSARTFSGDATQAGTIFDQVKELLSSCDLMIANASPFRGPSLEVGTALEIGLMLASDKPVIGYSLEPSSYADRLMKLHNVFELPLDDSGSNLEAPDGLLVENFDQAEGALLTGALLSSKIPVSEDFESAVRWGRRLLSE